MAVLEDIRKKGGIIVSVVIGISLLAFILGDFVPRGSSNYDIVKINGKTISYQAYEQKVEERTQYYQQRMGGNLDDRMQDMIREEAWQAMLNEEITVQEYKKIGLTVSPEELFDLVQGPNPSPTIRGITAFANPQTGEFDRSILVNFLRNKDSDPVASAEWNMLERELLKERYTQKYFGLISKGFFTPKFIVENENTEINKKVDFDYIMRPYSTIADSTVSLTRSDLKKYYEANRQQWEQNTSRDIEYVVFNIVPSEEDRAAADKWMEKIKPDFEKAEDAAMFVKSNSHVPFDAKFYTKDELPVQVTELFDGTEGDMAGPYQESDVLKLVRLVKIENRPDSVKARQIVLVPRQQSQQDVARLSALADSIKNAIESGGDFTSLALKYSADPAVANNRGDLGWIQESTTAAGSIFAQLFDLKKNEALKVEMPQGGIFIGQVTERGRETKKVQIATLQHRISASSRTEQGLYSQASKFAMENRTEESFNAAITAQNLNKRVAGHLGENDRQIAGLSSARPVVRWAYEAQKGDVSDVFNLPNAFVIACLKEIRKKGHASLEQVQSEVSLAVRKEKKAKQIAASLSETVQKAASFGDLALQLELPVESATGITFSSFSVPGAGIEPKLIAAAISLDEGKISPPIEGSNGVFLLTVKQITALADSASLEEAKMRLSATSVNRSMSESLQAINKAAEIKDMRSKFY